LISDFSFRISDFLFRISDFGFRIFLNDMTIGIYSPYLDTLGGGERYMCTLASELSKNHSVSLFGDHESVKSAAEERFGLDLSHVAFVKDIFTNTSLIERTAVTRKYDAIIFLTDGSLPVSFAKKNILHIQVPLPSFQKSEWKTNLYSAIVFNSEFTRQSVHSSYQKKGQVIYPPVDASDIVPSSKRDARILTVGRFTSHHESKKQRVMIEAFISQYGKGIPEGWSLTLAGGMAFGDTVYLSELKKLASNYPITFAVNVARAELVKLYSTSSIYWHAAGFGESDPSLMEHFGISTVEAMAGGTVPVVFNAGGQREIVTDGVNGRLWNSVDELCTETRDLIQNETLRVHLATEAMCLKERFSVERFTREWEKVLGK
jgi:glycosyltransferase involved in cell wall biosynthesis